MSETRSEFGEPWERKISENGPDGRLLAYVSSDRFRILMDKIGDPPDVYMLTDRIVACVNFLAGVPTEILRRAPGEVQFINDRPVASLSFPIQPLKTKPFVVLEQ